MRKLHLIIILTIFFWTFLSQKTFAETIQLPLLQDTFIKSGFPNQNLSQQNTFFVGYDEVYLGYRTRTYIQLDELAVRSIVQNDSGRIHSAKIMLYQNESHSSNSYLIKVYDIARQWNENQVTWMNQPTTQTLIKIQTIPNSVEWKEIDITDWIINVINGLNVEYGIAIVAMDEFSPGGSFCSSNNSNDNDEKNGCSKQQCPYLLIEYEPDYPPTPGNIITSSDKYSTNNHYVTIDWTEGSDNNNDEIINYVEISLSPEFHHNIYDAPVINNEPHQVNLPEHTTYYVRIRYFDGVFSSYSNTVEIEIKNTPPTEGNIVFPTNNATLSKQEITFEWEKGNDLEEATLNYTLIVSTDPVFSNYVIIEDLDDTTTYKATLDDGTYYAKVRYFDGYDSKYSPTISFSIQTASSPHSEISPSVITPSPKEEIMTKTYDSRLSPPSISLKMIDTKQVVLQVKAQPNTQLFINISGNLLPPYNLIQQNTEITITHEFIPGIEYQLFGYIKNNEKQSEASNPITLYIPLISELGIGSGDDKNQIKTDNGKCYLEIHQDKNTISDLRCSIPAPNPTQILTSENQNKKYIDLSIMGTMFNDIEIEIKYIKCKKYPWFVPRFLQKCRNEVVDTEKINISSPRRSLRLFDSNTNKVEWGLVSFGPATGGNIYQYQHLLRAESIDKSLQIANFVLIEFKPQKHNQWLSYYKLSNKSNVFSVPEIKKAKITYDINSKYFDFVLDHYPQVTQWHGDTAYRKDHSGIDFGVKQQQVFAPADGIVRYSQWNEYDGECYQGGNTIRIEHPNGMYSVFFHLENYTNNSGNDTKVGDIVKKGDLIGTSGNTGYYNCKPLGYHLHFELRKSKDRVTHVNPVPYVDVDWTQIKTVPNNKNALTGDNPHPNY